MTHTAESVAEQFEIDYELDYSFKSKEEFVRVKWREKTKPRARWHKVAMFKSEVHPTLGDLITHRNEYLAAWLNMREEGK